MRNPTEVLKNLMEKSKNETTDFRDYNRTVYSGVFIGLRIKISTQMMAV